MGERSFRMRLMCRYEAPDNSIDELEVETFEEGEWRELKLGTLTPGFLVFAYAVFTCQHLYFRTNCAERELSLESAQGRIELHTTEDWDLTRLRVHFDANLKSGTASPSDIDYIISRMRQCPVSRNMREPSDSQTTLNLR